jgi:hypothetical protein
VPRADTLLYVTGGVAAAAGTALAIWALLSRSTQSGCPSGDVPESGGTCPSGYIPDPNYPGCCKQSSIGSGLVFEISGSGGPISLACPCTLTLDDLVLQVSGATPGGAVKFFISSTQPESGDWIQLQECSDPNCDTVFYVVPNADAYGNVSDVVSSCLLEFIEPQGATLYDGSTCQYASGCIAAPCLPWPEPLYMIAYDVTSGNYSNVVTINPVCNCEGYSFGCCNS